MSKIIGNLSIGSVVMDDTGYKYTVIAKNHYKSGQVTLMSQYYIKKAIDSRSNARYQDTEVHVYLNNTYPTYMSEKLLKKVETTTIPCPVVNYTASGAYSNYTYTNVTTKFFIPSARELGSSSGTTLTADKTFEGIESLRGNLYRSFAWTRTQRYDTNNYTYEHYDPISGRWGYASSTSSAYVHAVFNVSNDLMVSDSATDGCYAFIFDNPPTIETISNISTDFGTPININYIASDDIDLTLNHYISFNNGDSWEKITPSSNGTKYTYICPIKELGVYNCRIKVVDSSSSETISNLFTITIKAAAPTVNIVSVNDTLITFKANCTTHNVSKVEILINDAIVKTYSSGFDLNLVYEVDSTLLNSGKNAMKIKATSDGDLEGYKELEINKEAYSLPIVGSKVVIDSDTYSILGVAQNGVNQIYTLESDLLVDVAKGQEIKITQDSVKVLCSLTNLENSTDFKEMKLVKTKKLKGSLEGYVEEKYELEGEGRYSSIKLETERFNNQIESEIIELQQYFDYMQD